MLRRRGTCCRRQACSLRRRFRVTSRRPACNLCNSSSSACIAPATRNRSTLHARTRPDQAAPLARLLNSDSRGGTRKSPDPWPSMCDGQCVFAQVCFFIHIRPESRSARVPICALAQAQLLMRKAKRPSNTQTPVRPLSLRIAEQAVQLAEGYSPMNLSSSHILSNRCCGVRLSCRG